MNLKDYLGAMVKKTASDLFLTTHASPTIKVEGQFEAVDDHELSEADMDALVMEALDVEQQKIFEEEKEMNLALDDSDLGRFRVNAFLQRNQKGMVIRRITTDLPSFEALGVADVLKDLSIEKRGLILFVGATGSGKSTTLAAMIDHRNANTSSHIITIEDPLEFVHPNKKSIVEQREVGLDTNSYGEALKNTLRQAPDVILIGEIRADDTMGYAIAFAETGHLCLSTLHANNANQALDRIINFFPEQKRNQLLLDLSLNLKAIISQRLIVGKDGKRCVAMEIMLNSPLIRDLIRKGKVDEIKEIMKKSENQGMQTFDAALYHLYKDGKITEEEALANADSRNDVRLRIQLDKGVKVEGQEGLKLQEEPEPEPDPDADPNSDSEPNANPDA